MNRFSTLVFGLALATVAEGQLNRPEFAGGSEP
jgi:hypothetical protein